MEKDIQLLLEKLPDIIRKLRQNRDGQAYKELSAVLGKLNEIIVSFVSIIPELNRQGLELSEDMIVRQLKNVVDGFEFHDNILLADSLEYEIMDSLGVYSEILAQIQ